VDGGKSFEIHLVALVRRCILCWKVVGELVGPSLPHAEFFNGNFAVLHFHSRKYFPKDYTGM
jgi:hypothetical protein